jgi:hypothetical protein
METIRFNRHEIFTTEDHAFHSQTIRQVEDFYMEQDKSWFNETYNMLCGVWDGYLYGELIESAQANGFPENIVDRIKTTIKVIKK